MIGIYCKKDILKYCKSGEGAKERGAQFDPKIADIMLQMIDEDKEYLMKQTGSMIKHILAVERKL